MTAPASPLFLSYSIAPDPSLPLNTFRVGASTPPNDSRVFTCWIYNATGQRLWVLATENGTNQLGPCTFDSFKGNTLTARLNYDNSNQPDTVVPLVFNEDVSVALNQQKIQFNWSTQTVAVSSPSRPLIELDPQGTPIVLSYDIPEPTSYRGRQIIELDFPKAYFRASAQAATDAGQDSQMSAAFVKLSAAPITAASDIYASDAPLLGDTEPTDRAPATKLSEVQIVSAFNVAKATGRFDPAVFPNINVGGDPLSLAGVVAALRDLQADTVVTQMNAGKRLTIYRDTSGRFLYSFISEPVKGSPSVLLVEYYRLSSFPARYGAGKTIKTFSLLPGEKSTIRINTYKRSAQTMSQASSILDSTSEDTESQFETSVLAEQTAQDAASRSLEYHAEAQAEGKASWGWGSASVSASGGVKGATNATREEFAKNVSNAVSQNSARASSRRDVQVDTSLDIKLEAGEEEAVERELSNVNVSRTLNFVFRQMNQEYITLLHLVDIRVAFFNGYNESRMEVPLPQLNNLLNTYILPTYQDPVRQAITNELQTIVDYRGQTRNDFVQTMTLTADNSQTPPVSYLRVNPDAMSSYQPSPDSAPVTVPGVILSADSHVMRTDGVVVDTFLGLGNGLDNYSTGLQQQAVRARQIDNDRAQADIDRIELALQIIRNNNTTAAAIYQQIFPTTPIINQIDHAAITSSSDASGNTSNNHTLTTASTS